MRHLKKERPHFNQVNVARKGMELDFQFFISLFFPKPKRFGCFVAAVLLILSPKELI